MACPISDAVALDRNHLRISLIGARAGDLGLGNPFKFLYPDLPDYSDFIP